MLSCALSCARPVCFAAITSLMVKNCAGAGAGVLEVRGAMVPRRGGVVTGATTGAATGGIWVASEAITIGCDARSDCGTAVASPAATFATTGSLLAAVALVSSTDTATKPKNSNTTGSH